MEEQRRKIIFLKKREYSGFISGMKFIFFQKSYIITPEILESFLVTNIAGSWIIFLLYSFILGGKL